MEISGQFSFAVGKIVLPAVKKIMGFHNQQRSIIQYDQFDYILGWIHNEVFTSMPGELYTIKSTDKIYKKLNDQWSTRPQLPLSRMG